MFTVTSCRFPNTHTHTHTHTTQQARTSRQSARAEFQLLIPAFGLAVQSELSGDPEAWYLYARLQFELGEDYSVVQSAFERAWDLWGAHAPPDFFYQFCTFSYHLGRLRTAAALSNANHPSSDAIGFICGACLCERRGRRERGD